MGIEDVRDAPREPSAPAPADRRGLREDAAAESGSCSTAWRQLYAKHTSRIGTGELNRFLAELREQRPGPAKGNRRLNLLYGTQVSTRPPRFRFFVNDPGLLTRDYGYWVENRLREHFGLEGVPVIIDFVRRG